ncbi:MAG: fluoride efflux transporter CrcB [Gemella sp.]|nr:fluoride efflux transporter CrcB [Gemella sp.]
MMNIIFIGIGGALGAIARHSLGLYIKNQFNTVFPVSTYTINIIGCLIIGILYGILDKYNLGNSVWNYLLVIGFCGSFTTFSTFANENVNLFQNGNIFTAICYIMASVIIGIISVKFGYMLIK